MSPRHEPKLMLCEVLYKQNTPPPFPKYLTTEVEVRRKQIKQIISTYLNFLNYLCLALDTADSEFTTLEFNTFNLPKACLDLQ